MLTDLVGYTALTQKDERAALRLLEEHRDIVRPVLRSHHGHEIKTIGDAFLVEFESALEATQCAVEIQRALHRADPGGPDAKVQLRIGIHVGDVVHRDGDVYGDAVNIVSRIEPLAEPGGVCLSQTVFDQVRNKIDLPLRKLEPQHLRNVLFPVDVYQLELPWSRQAGLGSPWVGRASEIAAFSRAFDQASKGVRTVLFVTGEEGIGKTRLIDEAIRLASERGFRVLRSRCVRTDLAAPYAPWSEAIREFVRSSPNQLVYKIVGNYANEIVKLVPDLAERLGPVTPAPSADPDQARLRFYEGVTQFFSNVAREGPTIVVFDDLQWADPASLRLFAFAARGVREHGIVLVAAFAEPEEGADGPLADFLRDARREHLGEPLVLKRLTREQVGELVGRMFGETEISGEFRELLFDRTGGNPFYLTETLRSLVDEGMIYRTAEGRWERKEIAELHIPRTIRDAIRERFNRLDKGVQETLRVASVLGTTFSVDVLRELVGLDEETLIRQLESAVVAHTLREEPVSHGALALSFTDAHVRDVLYTEMLAIRRARYHRQAAAAIERLSKGASATVAADLAHHYREGHDAAKALGFTVLAGDAARNVYAFDQAVQQYLAALELLKEAPDPGLEARVLAYLGECHVAQGSLPPALREWESAVRLYVKAGEPVAAAALADRVADLLRLHPRMVDDAVARIEALLSQARTLLEAAPPGRELAFHYDMEAAWLVSRQQYEAARERLEKAVALARNLGDVGLELGFADEFAMVATLDQKDEAVARLEKKAEYFARPETLDITQLMWSYANLASAAANIRGDPSGSLRWAEHALELARSTRNASEERRLTAVLVLPVLVLAGQLDRAEAELRRLLLASASPEDTRFVEAGLLRLDLARGDVEAAANRLARLPELLRRPVGAAPRSVGLVLELSALYHTARGERSAAVAELRELLALSRLEEDRSLSAIVVAVAAGALAEALLDGEEAADHVEEATHLIELARRISSKLDHRLGLALTVRLEALLYAHTRPELALPTLERAVVQLRKADFPLELAATLRRLARWYRERGEIEKADLARAEAIEVLTRVGARAAARAVEAEAEVPARSPHSGPVADSG